MIDLASGLREHLDSPLSLGRWLTQKPACLTDMDSSVERSSWTRIGLDVARKAIWLPGGVFALHVIASRWLMAYEAFPALDIPMHLAGGFAIAFFFHVAIGRFTSQRLIPELGGANRFVVIFSLVCTSTVFWEFAEYVSDHTVGTHAQLSLEDTLFDMLLGIVGGTIFMIGTAAVRARNEASPDESLT